MHRSCLIFQKKHVHVLCKYFNFDIKTDYFYLFWNFSCTNHIDHNTRHSPCFLNRGCLLKEHFCNQILASWIANGCWLKKASNNIVEVNFGLNTPRNMHMQSMNTRTSMNTRMSMKQSFTIWGHGLLSLPRARLISNICRPAHKNWNLDRPIAHFRLKLCLLQQFFPWHHLKRNIHGVDTWNVWRCASNKFQPND